MLIAAQTIAKVYIRQSRQEAKMKRFINTIMKAKRHKKRSESEISHTSIDKKGFKKTQLAHEHQIS